MWAPRHIEGDKPKSIISWLDLLNPVTIGELLKPSEKFLSEGHLLKDGTKDECHCKQLHFLYRKFKLFVFLIVVALDFYHSNTVSVELLTVLYNNINFQKQN